MNPWCLQEARANPYYTIGQRIYKDTDPDVLSSNHSRLVERVKEGKFIYLGDETGLQIEAGQDCSLVLGEQSDTFIMFYSFGLRNNSAYGEKVARM